MFDLGRTLLASVERSPDALAIIDGDRRLTYAQWYREIGDIAAGLMALGLARGDRLAVVLRNRLDIASLHWACQLTGIVVTPLNWRTKADELDYCLGDSGAAAVAFDGVAAAAVAGSAAARRVRRIALDTPGGTVAFEAWRGIGGDVTPRAKPEDLSLLLYTSGTTGSPKACRAATVPSAPRPSPMSRRTFMAAASARLGSCRSITRWGCARCWRWRWSMAVLSVCRALILPRRWG
jgi:2-furoate---CoA ligase